MVYYYIVSVLFLLSFWCPCMAICHEEVLYLQPLIPPTINVFMLRRSRRVLICTTHDTI